MNRRSFIKRSGVASLGIGLNINKTFSNSSCLQSVMSYWRICTNSPFVLNIESVLVSSPKFKTHPIFVPANAG